MITHNNIERPKKRNAIRKVIGREYFILKRHVNWVFNKKYFAKADNEISFQNSLIQHRSLLLCSLKNVDMHLQYNKVTNLRLAIKNVNNVVIKPGMTFSIWKLVGRPTRVKGYLDGLTLENGNISRGTGGGLCQLGNLIYWMALHTPLTIKERWRHCYDVFPDINRTIPFACGATLSYNYIDLQLKNDTGFTFQIKLSLDNEFLNGEITCSDDLNLHYEIFETDHIFQHQWWGGYTRHNKIWKRITNLSDNTKTEELVTENNAIMMYNPMLGK